jgi:phosphoribosylamine---glycine ligase
MKILVIGSGAREHALVWKLMGERFVREVYCAPGNAGTGRIAHNVAIPADDVEWLALWAAENKIDLTVVGPEAPLALGVVDHFRAHDLRIVGPTAAAARIESSKVFAKEFMARHGIPTAPFEVFPKEAAVTYVRGRPADDYPLVLKADGLAGGKGAVVAATPAEAEQALETLGRLPGGVGERVVIEGFLRGTELSVLALTDGTTILPLPAARDYKRLGTGDTGPMTGGMGAYSPPAIATDALLEQVRTEILEPAVRGLAAEGTPYSGVLYAGLMITDRGPRVLEFNTRFGDPET